MAEGTRNMLINAGGALLLFFIRDGKQATTLEKFELMEQQQDIVLQKVEMLNGLSYATIQDESMSAQSFASFDDVLEYLNNNFRQLYPRLRGHWNYSSDSAAEPGNLPIYDRTKQTFNYTNEDGFEVCKLYFDEGVFSSVLNGVFN